MAIVHVLAQANRTGQDHRRGCVPPVPARRPETSVRPRHSPHPRPGRGRSDDPAQLQRRARAGCREHHCAPGEADGGRRCSWLTGARRRCGCRRMSRILLDLERHPRLGRGARPAPAPRLVAPLRPPRAAEPQLSVLDQSRFPWRAHGAASRVLGWVDRAPGGRGPRAPVAGRHQHSAAGCRCSASGLRRGELSLGPLSAHKLKAPQSPP